MPGKSGKIVHLERGDILEVAGVYFNIVDFRLVERRRPYRVNESDQWLEIRAKEQGPLQAALEETLSERSGSSADS